MKDDIESHIIDKKSIDIHCTVSGPKMRERYETAI